MGRCEICEWAKGLSRDARGRCEGWCGMCEGSKPYEEVQGVSGRLRGVRRATW